MFHHLARHSVTNLRLLSSVRVPDCLIPKVPKEAIKKSFSCSDGPGGQHVNKVATKAEIRFQLDSPWIPDKLKPVLVSKYGYRVNKDGEVLITSSKTRSQVENLDDCFEKLREMMQACAVEIVLAERKAPNPEEAQLLEQRREKAAHFRLLDKKRHSLKKRLRSTDVYD
uniref:Large ribosomal subunit protein mL62 n=1 Tax=Panagrellus redivivus TaxID=6233 RepID=A0A7E4V647_PANRE